MAIQSRAPHRPGPECPGPTVLLTRPAPQSRRFAEALAARFGAGLQVEIAPLMTTRPLSPVLPAGPFAALVLTSEAAAEAAGRLLAKLPLPHRAWCVGERTAIAARLAGFEATPIGGDADALIAGIAARGETGPLLHLRGRESRGEVAKRLSAYGIATAEAIVYAQEALPLSWAARSLLTATNPVILPLFSPRSAALFAAAAPDFIAPLHIAAISPAVAEAAAPLAPIRLLTAGQPDGAAMLDLVAALLCDPAAT